ncbi:hypothetical protein CC79DRAFT_1331475 [Sarocladium strictum]
MTKLSGVLTRSLHIPLGLSPSSLFCRSATASLPVSRSCYHSRLIIPSSPGLAQTCVWKIIVSAAVDSDNIFHSPSRPKIPSLNSPSLPISHRQLKINDKLPLSRLLILDIESRTLQIMSH